MSSEGWLPWLVFLILIPFGWAAWRGAPWLPTKAREARQALDLLNLEPGQIVVDIGSGTGSFLFLAAKSGLRAVGYELNPWLWFYSRVKLWPYRDLVTLRRQDYWRRPLPECDGVYVFLIDRHMERLNSKLEQELIPGTKVVSYAFKLPRLEERVTETGLYLYKY